MKQYPKSIPINGRVRVCLEFLKSEKLKAKTILDVGSTFGWLAREVQSDHPKQYMGVEPNIDAVQFSVKNVRSGTFKQGDAANIPYKSKSADIAVFFDVIEHVPVNTENECLNEINRVLKPKGVLLLSTPYDHWITKLLDPAFYFGHRHYSQQKLIKLLKKSHFEVQKFEVRGGVVSLIYMIAFYIGKWVFKKDLNGTWLQAQDNESYSHQGIATVYLKAVKTN